ncbi:3'(2'),5'-bisphosphate nucleotidase [Trichoderma simmonsii]|uniref:3'(2'),5'-bisphosphate nucleotidase n=1 Tax=Trichoderma simmonsii TaxID=1491479 RepID=A0A8G0LEZ8_9HYPO|nr:3'(2'),5'-bisphosphate nucleotidase [Trichoderma simmonsii]
MSSSSSPHKSASSPSPVSSSSSPSSKLRFFLFLALPAIILILALLSPSTGATTASLSLSIARIVHQPGQQLSSLLRHTRFFSLSTTTVATMRLDKYEKELQIAQLAVQRASILTKRVFHEKAKGTVDKNDKSPVTIGDFGAQALIIAALQHNFPDDAIVAEEESAKLKEDANLRATIWDLVKDTKLDDAAAEELLGGPIKDVDAMVELIDKGNSPGGSQGRIWAIDPIDGTKGFLRGGQYAVCLALMVDGDVKVGALGCPNLPIDNDARLTAGIGENQTDEGHGVLFSAVQGHGATSRPLATVNLDVEAGTPISMRAIDDLTKANFCESVEAGHSSHGDQAAISQKLGITAQSVRMDSQAKYGSIARGAGDIYLRLPVSATYQEKIWDHAAGDLIVRESGGQVTDIHGKRLDFSIGRTLAGNKGVVAAPLAVHGKVLEAVQEVLSAKL